MWGLYQWAKQLVGLGPKPGPVRVFKKVGR